MSDPKTTYVERISSLKFGLPLFTPSSIQLGDVGFVKPSDGSFQAFYNIAQPDTSIEGSPAPVDLVRAEPDFTEWQALHVRAKSTQKADTSSESTPEVDARFQFSRVGAGDVILIPGGVVRNEQLRRVGELKKYFESHIKWIQQTFSDKENISPDDLMLVIGTIKTNRWAIAVNTDKAIEAKLSFTVRDSGTNGWGEWSKNLGHAECGPHIAGSALPPPDDGPKETIFINCIQPSDFPREDETSSGWAKRIGRALTPGRPSYQSGYLRDQTT